MACQAELVEASPCTPFDKLRVTGSNAVLSTVFVFWFLSG